MKPLYKIVLLLIVSALIAAVACKRNFEEADAFALVDKISLSYGNERIFNTFTITNTGQQNLNYLIDEELEWLEVMTATTGNIEGNTALEVTCRVTRSGLARNNYHGVVNVKTGTGDFSIDVFMMVDMFPVTFINPVFSTIELFADTVEFSGTNAALHRNIGAGDSVQFGFFSRPALMAYYGQTSGMYTDSTQLGLTMEWNGSRQIGNIEQPRFVMDISKAYFHLSIINTFQVLTPLFINPGTQFEIIENIFIPQNTLPQPIGYYQALGNTSIRALVAGSSSSVTWSNNNHFTLSDTVNQSVVVASYNSDTIPKKSGFIPEIITQSHNLSDGYGTLIRISGKEK
jgi:hypothetical protein